MKNGVDLIKRISPFSLRFQTIDNGEGYWNSVKVGIFRGRKKLGEYIRTYHAYHDTTFFPFEIENKGWFAIYSRDYTATRIMKLPECEDIGGEEGAGDGFCPVELFVPFYRQGTLTWGDEFIKKIKDSNPISTIEKTEDAFLVNEQSINDTRQKMENNTESDQRYKYEDKLRFADFAFISGCVWGDDGSWKLQYIDLSEADTGIIKRSDKFGYHQLPDNQTLFEAMSMRDWQPSHNWIHLNGMKVWNLDTDESY